MLDLNRIPPSLGVAAHEGHYWSERAQKAPFDCGMKAAEWVLIELLRDDEAMLRTGQTFGYAINASREHMIACGRSDMSYQPTTVWLAYAPPGEWSSGPAVLSFPSQVGEWKEIGYEVYGPYDLRDSPSPDAEA